MKILFRLIYIFFILSGLISPLAIIGGGAFLLNNLETLSVPLVTFTQRQEGQITEIAKLMESQIQVMETQLTALDQLTVGVSEQVGLLKTSIDARAVIGLENTQKLIAFTAETTEAWDPALLQTKNLLEVANQTLNGFDATLLELRQSNLRHVGNTKEIIKQTLDTSSNLQIESRKLSSWIDKVHGEMLPTVRSICESSVKSLEDGKILSRQTVDNLALVEHLLRDFREQQLVTLQSQLRTGRESVNSMIARMQALAQESNRLVALMRNTGWGLIVFGVSQLSLVLALVVGRFNQ